MPLAVSLQVVVLCSIMHAGSYVASASVVSGDNQSVRIRATCKQFLWSYYNTKCNNRNWRTAVTTSLSITTRTATTASAPTSITATQSTNTNSSTQTVTCSASGGSGTLQFSNDNSTWGYRNNF